ncbi:TetR family transcriptional regulator [Streptomyces sp. NPDC058667]
MVHEQGIGAVPMDAVAARAGVGKPAIHGGGPPGRIAVIGVEPAADLPRAR